MSLLVPRPWDSMPDRGRADGEVMTHSEYPSCVNFRQEIMLSGMCWQFGDTLLAFLKAFFFFLFLVGGWTGGTVDNFSLLLLLIFFSNNILHQQFTMLLWCGRFLVLLCFPVFLQVRRNQVWTLWWLWLLWKYNATPCFWQSTLFACSNRDNSVYFQPPSSVTFLP